MLYKVNKERDKVKWLILLMLEYQQQNKMKVDK